MSYREQAQKAWDQVRKENPLFEECLRVQATDVQAVIRESFDLGWLAAHAQAMEQIHG